MLIIPHKPLQRLGLILYNMSVPERGRGGVVRSTHSLEHSLDLS